MRKTLIILSRLTALICLSALLLPTAHGTAQAKPASVPVATVSLTTGAPAGRYTVGQPVSVTVSQTNPSSTSRTYTRSETLTDYFGVTTNLLTDTITLAPGGSIAGTVPVPINGAGYYEFHLTLTDQASNQQVTATASIGVMRPQPTGLDTQSAFGTSGSLTQAYGGDQQTIANAAAAMAAAGIRYDREELNWQVIEPKPGSGQFSFARTDAAIIAAHNAGIQVLGLLSYWGNLPQPDTTQTISGTDRINTITGCSKGPVCAYTSAGNNLFAAFAAAAVNHYKPGGTLAQQQGWNDGYGITDWEVWNEPSTIAFWRHDLLGYQSLFANLYKAASTAVRQADPKAKVMYDESGPTIDAAIKAAGATSETSSVHSYSGGLDPDSALASPTLPRGGQGTAPAAISSIVAQGKPVWITETGYVTDGTVTSHQQAQYLVRSYVDFLAEGVKKNFWFKFHEDAPGGENLYGITNQNLSPKPAYIAYATMARHLQGATFAVSASVGSAVRAILFTRTDGATEAVLWSTAENGSMLIPANAGQGMTADDSADNPTGQTSPAGVNVPLSGDPVYLTVPNTTPARLAGLLQHALISGINPVGVQVSQAPGLSNGLPNVKATVSARINLPISGTVTLALPNGWTTPASSQRFPTLQPGQSATLNFRLNGEINHLDDHISATARTTTGLFSI
ncbi:MAG: Carbohydrate-binding family 9, partial [Chloroflexi bacterium]|nr:Carbohydrate-binding family 9 [Chloroflexota bacterium]